MMRPAILGLGLAATLALACGGDDDGPDCECSAVGCFADICTKTVFVTSTEIPADFGGVAAADGLCAQEAAAAGLPGTFLAWLSDSTQSPHGRFTRPTVPYTLPDGTQIAADWDSLVDGPTVPIAQHADQTAVPPDEGSIPAQVWTGTNIDGRPDTYNNASNYCANWTANIIDNSTLVGWVHQRIKPRLDWTRANLVPCTGAGYLYCFQQ